MYATHSPVNIFRIGIFLGGLFFYLCNFLKCCTTLISYIFLFFEVNMLVL